jgi:hypothetical protein
MLQLRTFLRDKGDPSDPADPKDPQDPEIGDPKPDAEPQGGDPKDPEKPGLSAEEKAELQRLKDENETLNKRVADNQTAFHTSQAELKSLKERLEGITAAPKSDEQFADDPIVQKIDGDIKRYNEMNWDTASLEIQKDMRIDQIKSQQMLSSLEKTNREGNEIGQFLSENPDVQDLTPAGQAKKALTDRGEKVSIETAHFYNLGKSRKEDFDKSVQAEVQKQLEALKRGDGARLQDGSYEEPKDEEKEKEEYTEFLHDPSGLDIQ